MLWHTRCCWPAVEAVRWRSTSGMRNTAGVVVVSGVGPTPPEVPTACPGAEQGASFQSWPEGTSTRRPLPKGSTGGLRARVPADSGARVMPSSWAEPWAPPDKFCRGGGTGFWGASSTARGIAAEGPAITTWVGSQVDSRI